MIYLTPYNLPDLLMSFWQALRQRGPGAQAQIGRALLPAQMTYAAALDLVKALSQDADRACENTATVKTIESALDFSPIVARGRTSLYNMRALCRRLHQAGVGERWAAGTFMFDALADGEGKEFDKLDAVLNVKIDGRKSPPFEHQETGDDQVDRLQAAQALGALQNKLGRHVLKAAWVVIAPILVSALTKSLNVPREQVSVALDDFASGHGLS